MVLIGFSPISDAEYLFMCLLVICMPYFLKNLYFTRLYFFLIGSCMFICFEYSSLLIISFANIFSYSVGCIFVDFLCCAKAFKFNQVPFVHVCFYFFCLRRQNNAMIYVSLLPMFSSKSFVVSGLTFRSSISFEYIFVYGMRKCSNFFLLHVAVLFYQDYLLKR